MLEQLVWLALMVAVVALVVALSHGGHTHD